MPGHADSRADWPVQAAKLGNICSSPLCVPLETLSQDAVLQDGPQGLVSQGRWHDQKVAIKRAKITSSADMDRLKLQVRLLLLLGEHGRICPLIAARLLPPGEAGCPLSAFS